MKYTVKKYFSKVASEQIIEVFYKEKKSVFLQNVMLNEMIFLLTNDKFTSIFRVRIVS